MAVLEEHIVEVSVTCLADVLRYKVTLKAEVPLFVSHDRAGDRVYIKEAAFWVKPRRFQGTLRRRLRKAQKRYRKLEDFDNCEYEYSERVNLSHKL